MNQNEMIESVRAEIGKLQRVLDLLLDRSADAKAVPRPGAAKPSANRATSFNPEEFAPKKRVMSAEGKARIAAAQKKRWAKQKGVAPGRSTRSEMAGAKRTSKTASPASARKAAPAKAKKSTGAAKKTSSTQAQTQARPAKRAAIAGKKSAAKKSVTKRAIKSATKRPTKQAAKVTPERQAAV